MLKQDLCHCSMMINEFIYIYTNNILYTNVIKVY